MKINPIEYPMSMTVVEPLDFNGPFDVADQLFSLIRSVEQGRENNEDHLAVIRDVYARLENTRSRATQWLYDAGHCSSLNPDTFIDLAVTELFGLTDHIPIGPDGLLLDALEDLDRWGYGFDDWNVNSIEDAHTMLMEARDKIRRELEITVN